MAKKLYVGNLSYSATEGDLLDVFAKFGQVVSAKLITDPTNGRSKGFGFVEMASDEEANKAIAELNGSTFLDRAMTVNEARPQTDRPRFGGGGGRGGGGYDRSGGGGGGFGGKKKKGWR